MNKGPQTEESLQAAADGNAALERGIEELRVKYELKAAQEAKVKEAEERQARAAAAAAAGCAACDKERLDPTVDMTMEDADLEALRQARMEALKSKAAASKRHMESGGGEYREITEEDFLKEVTAHTSVVVHFYHEEFITCKVMDKHLRALAPRALGARFLKLEAKKANFFTAKLKVKVLPTLVYFRDGVATGRQTGFEGLVRAATDQDFPTLRLLRALQLGGVLGDAARREAAEGGEEDEEEEGGVGGGAAGGGGGAGGSFEAQLARARAKMLAEDAELGE